MEVGVPFGENWGNAYIEVHADTNPLRRELRVAAKRAAQQFGNEFGTEADSAIGKQMTQLGRRIEADLGRRGETAGRGFADDLERGVLSRLRGFDQKIVDSIISGDWSQAVEQFDDLDEAIDKINARWRQMARDADLSENAITDIHLSFRQWEKSVRSSDAWSKMVDEATRMNTAFDKNKEAIARNREEWDSLGRLIERATREMDTEFARRARLHKDDSVTTGAWAKGVVGQWSLVGDRVRLTSNEFGKFFRAQARDGSDNVSLWRRLTRSLKDFESGYEGVGRLAGSRNNILNTIGMFAGSAERGVGKLLDRILELPAAFSRFADRVQANGGGVQALFATLGQSIQSGIASLTSGDWVTTIVKVAVAIASVTVGLVLLNTALGIAVTAVSGLLGIATALASVLAYGIAGALLPLGPMALAAATGVGVLVAAFVGLDDATKDSFKSIGDMFKEISTQVRGQLFANLASQIDSVKGILNGFVGPLLVSGAVALRNVIDYMIQGFQDPAVQETLNGLAYVLPVILEDMGRALGDFLIGLLGFFDAIAPQVAGIVDGIAASAASFAEWANSAEGQEAIKTFFEEAASAASSLWDLIVTVGEALGTLFSQGTADGQTMLDKITEIIGKFAEWASSDEGRQQIADWFRRAGELASTLWGLIQDVGKVIDDLDNQQNMDSLNSLLRGIGYIVSAFDAVSGVAAGIGSVISGAFELAARGVDVLTRAAKKAADAIKDVLGKVSSIGGTGPLGSLLWGRSATGGVFGAAGGWAGGNVAMNPQMRLIGEAGAEAVVPLNRSLNMVDPSVRELSAFAQGKLNPKGNGYGAYFAPGAVQVSTPAANPVMVANQVVDRIAESVTS